MTFGSVGAIFWKWSQGRWPSSTPESAIALAGPGLARRLSPRLPGPSHPAPRSHLYLGTQLRRSGQHRLHIAAMAATGCTPPPPYIVAHAGSSAQHRAGWLHTPPMLRMYTCSKEPFQHRAELQGGAPGEAVCSPRPRAVIGSAILFSSPASPVPIKYSPSYYQSVAAPDSHQGICGVLLQTCGRRIIHLPVNVIIHPQIHHRPQNSEQLAAC